MNKIFFVSTYDSITADFTSSILNLIPNLTCHTIQNENLLPSQIHKSLQEFAGTGNAILIPAFELQHKILLENAANLYITANITLNPITRLQLILHNWSKIGLTPDKLF